MEQHSCSTCLCGSYNCILDIGLLLTRRLLNQGLLFVKFKSLLRCFTVATVTWLIATEYLCHKCSWICSVCRNFNPVRSSFTTSRRFLARAYKQVPLVEQELLTLSEHMSSSQVFSGVHVAQSLALCEVFCRCLFVLLYFFSFGHCIVCPPLTYII